MPLLRLFCGLLLALSAVPALAQDKRLDWRRLDVAATLDRDGRLHVVETHAMVFNGDWNGGERRFHLRIGETIQLEKISRIEPGGALHPLRPGDLTAVDQYAWRDANTLRWRSRLAADPPFDRQEIVYAIAYRLDNLLRAAGDEYVLHHDFAFPERDGAIENYTLHLQADPAWQSSTQLPLSLARADLRPGAGVVVRLALRHAGPGQPSGVAAGTAAALRAAIILGFLGALAVLAGAFFRAERMTGRFDPLPVDAVDRQWLEQNLFTHPPEVIGAAWDNRTAAAEVAAVLARMAGEGKLLTRIEQQGFGRKPALHLKLLVPRTGLQGYEATLVKSLFFGGDTTSTDLVRKHYKKAGLDLAAMLREPVSRQVKRLANGRRGRRAGTPRLRWAAIPIGLAIALLLGTGLQPAQNYVAAAAASGTVIMLFIFGLIAASDFAGRVVHLKLHALKVAVPLLLMAGAVVGLVWCIAAAVPLGIPVLLGVPLLVLGAAMIMLACAQTGDSPARLHLRRRLAAAREWFKLQLGSRKPQLEDAWVPYLLAFGLGPHIDRWFRASGAGRASAATGMLSPASGSSAASRWTGGGGTFGGAGATGSWASAAGGLAAGVSASASSGSSGGSGGGSSGGGGGGGW